MDVIYQGTLIQIAHLYIIFIYFFIRLAPKRVTSKLFSPLFVFNVPIHSVIDFNKDERNAVCLKKLINDL